MTKATGVGIGCLFLVLWVLIGSVRAQTLEKTLENGQITIQLHYLEPVSNESGSVVNDLSACFGVVDLKGDGKNGQAWTVPASRVTGGAERTTEQIVFLLTEAQAVSVREVTATGKCVDLTGNQSQNEILVASAINITVPVPPDVDPPGAPQQFRFEGTFTGTITPIP